MLSLSALRCSAKLLTLVSLCASIDAFVAFSPSGIQPAAVSGMFSRSRPCPRCRGSRDLDLPALSRANQDVSFAERD